LSQRWDNEGEAMRGWFARGWCWGAAFALCCSGSAQPARPPYTPPAEYWKFAFDGRVWEPAGKVRDKTSATETFVLPGQTEKNWSELVTTSLTFGAQRSTNVSAMAEMTKKGLEKDCPSFQWTYIERSERDLIYEWSRSLCKNAQAQHELTRLSAGRLGIHKLSYDAKTEQIATGLRRQWLKAIRDATLQLRSSEAPPSKAGPPVSGAPAAP
jgi:hypothetical protein